MLFRADLHLFARGFEVNAGAQCPLAAWTAPGLASSGALVDGIIHLAHGAVQDKARALSLLQKRHLTCLRQCLRAIFPELRRC